MRIVVNVAALLALASTLPLLAQQREPVTFKDEIRQFVMKGDDTEKVDIILTIDDKAVIVRPKGKRPEISSAFDGISSMTYDRRSRMRKMAPTWGRAEDHFLTIQYKTADGVGEFVEMELGKNAAPRVVATLESRSGKKIERASGS